MSYPGIMAWGAIVALLATSAGSALADTCGDLRNELIQFASTDRTDSVEEARYVSALAQQNLELRKARTDERRLRCRTSSIVQIRPDGTSDCDELGAAIERMQVNLQILSEKLRELRGRDKHEQLIDRLVQEGCSLEGIVTDEASHRLPYLDTTSNTRIAMTTEKDLPVAPLPTGKVRTLCVRTCDGGFFPINSQSSPQDFGRDAARCQSMCPGLKTELFYQSLFDPDTSEMISAQTGQPYRNLPTAFTYRNRARDQSCTCDFDAFYENARGTPPDVRASSAGAKSIIDIPSQPAKAAPVAVSERPPAEERELDERTLNVRKVGPVFLPSDHGTIDLRNPSASGPQPLQDQ